MLSQVKLGTLHVLVYAGHRAAAGAIGVFTRCWTRCAANTCLNMHENVSQGANPKIAQV